MAWLSVLIPLSGQHLMMWYLPDVMRALWPEWIEQSVLLPLAQTDVVSGMIFSITPSLRFGGIKGCWLSC